MVLTNHIARRVDGCHGTTPTARRVGGPRELAELVFVGPLLEAQHSDDEGGAGKGGDNVAETVLHCETRATPRPNLIHITQPNPTLLLR